MPSFNSKQTTLDLNGPILSFSVHPSPTSSCISGIATFVGIATATFPSGTPINFATNTGYISYKWHWEGYGELNDGEIDGMSVAGSATTTLTLSNIPSSILFNEEKFFLRADYIPSAYVISGSDVSAGTARSTGNAVNDPKDSDLATLTVYPNLEITKNPGIATAAQGSTAYFSAEGSVIDFPEKSVSYQWQLNEVDLFDGINTISVPKNNSDYSTNSLLRLPLWDKNTGSLVLDDLTNVANTLVSTNVSWVSGGGKFYNGHAKFDADSFITITPSSDFNFAFGDFTVECWVYFTETGFNDIFSTGFYGQNQLSIRKNASSQLSGSPGSEQLEVYYNSTIIASGGKFNLNTWHHVAVSRKSQLTSPTERGSSTLRLFIDGIQVASASWNGNISSSDVKIGRTSGNVYNMIGRIQDFQVTGVGKYEKNFTPSSIAIVDKRLVLSLPLWDEGTGNLKLKDLSDNSKNITGGSTWGQSPTWVRDVGKFYGGAAYFNGYSYLNVPASNDFNFGTGDFTIELWVNFQKGLRTDSGSYGSVGGWEVLVCVGGGVYFGGGTWFALSRSTPLNDQSSASFYLADFASYTTIGTVSSLKVDKWYHLAVSRSSSSVRFFIDGVLIQNTPISSWSNQNFGGDGIGYIGLEHYLNVHERGYYFPYCYMQDLRIYKGIAKYTSEFIPDQNSIVSGISQNVTIQTEVSGAKTKNLSISLTNVSNNLVRAKVSYPNACNSPVYSNTAQFDVVSPASRAVVEVEAYAADSTTAILREFDLKDIEYTITSNTFDSDTICFYAKDRDLVVEMEMYGAKGEDSDYTFPIRESGGEGGYSKIRFTMRRNEEFILKGIKNKSALYLYRKAQLIACVGQGGKGGAYGAGGRGGGVGVSGESGFGRLSGIGGPAVAAGQLSGNGIFGSSSTVTTLYAGDSKALGTGGGLTITCSKGVYWRQQGKKACEGLGITKFRLPDGRQVSNSAAINRGFKEGYCINQTAGASSGDGGRGGNGATGGDGGSSGGGGGGSGYTDTSVTVIESTLGGHSAKETKVKLRLYEILSDFYIDEQGRILIFSAATPGKDPRTLEKTTSRVLPGTNSCIDDDRWQNFIELAKQENYRITGTLDGSTTPITRATDFNLRKMINSNQIPLRKSLTDWYLIQYGYPLYVLAWDETSGATVTGGDYSLLSWAGTTYYYGYYGESSNSYFTYTYPNTIYSNTTANYWILPPGVPDFS